MIDNNAGEDAYFECKSCGAEYNGEEVSVVEFSRTVANGDLGYCPLCGSENFVEYDQDL